MKKLLFLLAVIVATTLSAVAQNRTVSGVVLDADTDEPLIGASVKPVPASLQTSMDDSLSRFRLPLPNLSFLMLAWKLKQCPCQTK